MKAKAGRGTRWHGFALDSIALPGLMMRMVKLQPMTLQYVTGELRRELTMLRVLFFSEKGLDTFFCQDMMRSLCLRQGL